MTPEVVVRFKNVAPFVPFEMLLVDRRAVVIPHPDFVSIDEAEEIARIYDLEDGVEAIELLLVVSLRSPAPETKSPRQ